MPKNYCIMQIWAESGKSALPICNYSQILYQFLAFTQNLKRSLFGDILSVIGIIGESALLMVDYLRWLSGNNTILHYKRQHKVEHPCEKSVNQY